MELTLPSPRGRKSSVGGLCGSPGRARAGSEQPNLWALPFAVPRCHLAVLRGGSRNPHTVSTPMAATTVCVTHRCVPKPGNKSTRGYHPSTVGTTRLAALWLGCAMSLLLLVAQVEERRPGFDVGVTRLSLLAPGYPGCHPQLLSITRLPRLPSRHHGYHPQLQGQARRCFGLRH